MQYLVLRQFSSMGVLHKKGTVVDEACIRSPRLRQSEGKIIPAVPSFYVPAETSSNEESLQDTLNEVPIDSTESQVDIVTGDEKSSDVTHRLFSLHKTE